MMQENNANFTSFSKKLNIPTLMINTIGLQSNEYEHMKKLYCKNGMTKKHNLDVSRVILKAIKTALEKQ